MLEDRTPPPSAGRRPVPAAVLFDLDGTLVDTVGIRIEAWLAAFKRFGIPATHEQIAPLIGIDGRRLAHDVAAASGRDLDTSDMGELDRVSGAEFERRNQKPTPLPGVSEVVAALEGRGIGWAIATSSRREQVATSIRALGLRVEPMVIDGSHVERAKPEPDMLLLAAREVGVEPASCWYVGDSTWDMVSAVAAGMLAVGVTAGSAVTAMVLTGAGAQVVVPTLAGLVALIVAVG